MILLTDCSKIISYRSYQQNNEYYKYFINSWWHILVDNKIQYTIKYTTYEIHHIL